MGAARIAPELAGIGLGAVARQGIDGEKDERGDAAGGEDAALGEQIAGERHLPDQLPGSKGGTNGQQRADRLRHREAEDRPQRVVEVAR
jgi:hypothetical protein